MAEVRRIVQPHIDSFNFFVSEGLDLGIKDMVPVEVWKVSAEEQELIMRLRIISANIQLPSKALNQPMFPSECRQARVTYGGVLSVEVLQELPDGSRNTFAHTFGRLPILVRSNRCHLHNKDSAYLIAHHEEENEAGGYFIVNGNEKLIRYLVLNRANHIFAIFRPSFENRGPNFTPYAAMIRCVRPDTSSITNYLHYCKDGLFFRFVALRQEWFVPVVLILKALADTTDREIYEAVMQSDTQNMFFVDRIELMLREARSRPDVVTKKQSLDYLGNKFRSSLKIALSLSDEQAGQFLLDRYVLVHLTSNKGSQAGRTEGQATSGRDKFNLLILMVQKILAVANGSAAIDNMDSPSNQEILMPGHMFSMFVKEQLEDWLNFIRNRIGAHVSGRITHKEPLTSKNFLSLIIQKAPDITKKAEYFLATGNLKSNSGLDLMQTSGFVIIAEAINYLRYVSHFQSIHRGTYFAEMKTTAVRKLVPESWGFLCCVHTPDGAPCGLVNHLTSACRITTRPTTNVAGDVPPLLASLGMTPLSQSSVSPVGHLPVVLDGRVLGRVSELNAPALVDKLRALKVHGTHNVPQTLEIGYIPRAGYGHTFPGVFLFSGSARMMRPVINLAAHSQEWVGSFEQVYLSIACLDGDLQGSATHKEISPTNILSMVAQLTPFSDFNQSPRNMYQCQMAKQTMGSTFHSLVRRVDNKAYRIQTPQRPLVRTEAQDKHQISDYAHGTNVVVAVVSYTGYDMEDAMIINKSAYERGFAHGSVYKTYAIDFSKSNVEDASKNYQYLCKPEAAKLSLKSDARNFPENLDHIDPDGLPVVGTLLTEGMVFYTTVDQSGKGKATYYKSSEPGYVDQVRLLGSMFAASEPGLHEKASIKIRLNRNPVIGDKFSSRHGQKGVLSRLYPEIDMPFSESGMRPDVLINPNAFPSRMTIGMLVESMAGKSGALHGMFQDATPFTFNEQNRAVDYFGEQLVKAGYNYYGNEPMYSGIKGTEFHADIYFGVVYYQRLRHMVKDKFQARGSAGPVQKLTQQPVKGRKMGGGIRFGEMERDSLLAHGAAFVLHDRLMLSSDYSKCHVCKNCGSLLSPISDTDSRSQESQVTCRECKDSSGIVVVALPYVFRFLATELASVNIKLTLDIK